MSPLCFTQFESSTEITWDGQPSVAVKVTDLINYFTALPLFQETLTNRKF